jgi:hypothetical protein
VNIEHEETLADNVPSHTSASVIDDVEEEKRTDYE